MRSRSARAFAVPGWPRRGATLAAVVLILVLTGVAFAPFRSDLPGLRENGAHSTATAITFERPSRAVTSAPPSWLPAVIAGADLDVHIEARPTETHQVGPARLLALADDHDHGNLMIGHYEDDLIVRVRRSGSDAVGEPPVRVPDVFTAGTWRAIDVGRRGDQVSVHVDGELRGSLALGPVGLRAWDPRHRLALGDDPARDRQWLGDIRAATVTVGATRWDYLHDDLLEVPGTIWYVPDRIRHPLAVGSGGVPGALAHLLSFVPLGALLVVLVRGPRRFVRAITASTVVALALALGKTGFEGRHPSLVDVLAQSMGAAIGAGSVCAAQVMSAAVAARARRPPGCAPACGGLADHRGAR